MIDHIFGIEYSIADEFVLEILGNVSLAFSSVDHGAFVFEGTTTFRVDVEEAYCKLILAFEPKDIKCFVFNRRAFKLKDFLEGFPSKMADGTFKEFKADPNALKYDYDPEEFKVVELTLINNKTQNQLLQIEFGM